MSSDMGIINTVINVVTVAISFIAAISLIVGQPLPCIILVKDGSLIPQVPVAQSTDKINWSKLSMRTFKADAAECVGYLYLPGSEKIAIVKREFYDSIN